MKTLHLKTPLGPMIAVADDFGLYVLDFEDNPDLHKMMDRINGPSISGVSHLAKDDSPVLPLVQKELQAYFEGTLTTFTVPLAPQGTVFQKRTWSALSKVPYGTTKSYADIATAINQPGSMKKRMGNQISNDHTESRSC